jgi:multiple sugar transport system substrate-binding protein
MAKGAMEGMQEFMLYPENLDDILERLEELRADVYE